MTSQCEIKLWDGERCPNIWDEVWIKPNGKPILVCADCYDKLTDLGLEAMNLPKLAEELNETSKLTEAELSTVKKKQRRLK